MLRIGPYVCAEYDNGGLPTYLGFTPGLRYRELNSPWLTASRTWFRTVLLELGKHFPQHGGPIVLVQVCQLLRQKHGSCRHYRWGG